MKKLLATLVAAIGLVSGVGAATIDLSALKDHKTLADGDVATGRLAGKYKISIADGATVTFRNVVIPGGSGNADVSWAGVSCKGDATIILEGTNNVTACHDDYPAIFCAGQLTIKGGGTLNAHGGSYGAGIGSGRRGGGGQVIIEGGKVNAYGGEGAAGIGGSDGRYGGAWSAIVIKGGIVYARGGRGGAGIGSGKNSNCDWITISGGTVDAYGGAGAAGIGSGEGGTLNVLLHIEPYIDRVTATSGEGFGDPIGAGDNGTCYSLYIESGLVDVTRGSTRTILPRKVKLPAVTDHLRVYDGMTLSGKLAGNYGIYIAPGATVTLSGVTIDGVNSEACKWAGITCEGNATIILEGENFVKGFYEDYPGVYVPVDNQLFIRGDGTLTALSNGYGAGIGGGYKISCGQIIIEDGTVNAQGGRWAAGIGAGYKNSVCIYVAVRGGTVDAKGGESAAGIGSGRESNCGGISIWGGSVSATGGVGAAGIGSGEWGTCISSIWIEQSIDCVAATCGAGCTNSIGAGRFGQSGEVKVAEGMVDTTVLRTRTITQREVYLDQLTEGKTIFDGVVVCGKLAGNHKLTIADGATVTLQGVTIEGVNSSKCRWAGLTCEGDATIILEGDNAVRGFDEDYPGIFVPEGKTLTIRGAGSLDASSNGYGAGIGGGYMLKCGNIVLDGGTIVATGGARAAGIGSGCAQGWGPTCGTIRITDGITRVVATCGGDCSNPIGAGVNGTGGETTVASGLIDETNGQTRTIKIDDLWNGNLSTLQGNAVACDGLQIYGKLSSNCKVSIAAGATVTLSGATIDGSAFNNQNCPWAGLTCEGDATIVLKGSNTIKGFYEKYPGIYVPEGKTLTIMGTGSLDASSSGNAAGIGAGSYLSCGNIAIEGGTIKASGGGESAGIGGAGWGNCGDIAIRGGFVTATGGSYAAGIGSGAEASCGTITIGLDITRVVATCGDGCNNPIGRGDGGWGATVNLADGLSSTISGSTEVIEKGIPQIPDDPEPVAMAEFESTDIMSDEGSEIQIEVKGGNVNAASSVKVYLTYNTAAATDVDLAKGAVDGTTPKGGLKFPLTLEWAAGDTSLRTISFPVKGDTALENNELLTLQLADASGMKLGDATVCNVTLHDPRYDELAAKIEAGTATKAETNTWNNLQKAQVPYIRGLAEPADGGKVTGSASCAEGKKVTLKATANKNFTFLGWFDEDGKIVAETATLVIDRTAKPAASTSTSTTITGVESDATFYAGFKGDPQLHIGVVATDNAGAEPTGGGLGKYKAGTITGMGRYAPGKKATMKAKANAGYVFAGWYDGEKLLSQAESYPFEMVDADTTLTAKFITVEEDRRDVDVIIDEAFLCDSENPACETSISAGVYIEWPLAVTAHSRTTVAVSGLPAGLKFTAKDIVDSKTKEVIVPANTIYGTPTAGSKKDREGKFVPSNVKITITTAGKNKFEFVLALTVEPLPEWVVGTFDGGGGDGQATLTVSSAGKISGKFLSGGQTWTLAAASFESLYVYSTYQCYEATLTATAGRLSRKFEVTLELLDDERRGGIMYVDDSDVGEVFRAYQNNWGKEPWKSIAKQFDGLTFKGDATDLDENDGEMALRFSASGKVAVKGSFVTGKDARGQDIVYPVSGSTVLAGPSIQQDDGAVRMRAFIYFPPKIGKFAGYMSEWYLEWNGKEFERVE